MSVVRMIATQQARDIVRSRWIVGYTLFFFFATGGLLRFGGGDVRALLSVANLMLFVTPLVTVVFGTTYLYNARDFTEMLLAQPVSRSELFRGLYAGLTVSLLTAWVVGTCIPMVIHGLLVQPETRMVVLVLLLAGAALTSVFTALATLVAFKWDERLKGVGVAIALWLGMALLYDGVVLVLVSMLSDRPIEPAILGLMALNPVDLARVVVLLQLDVSALLGYTGAVFHRAFADGWGYAAGAGALALWIGAPLALAARGFHRKDF